MNGGRSGFPPRVAISVRPISSVPAPTCSLTPTGGAANRNPDQEGKDSGQFGFQARFRVPGSDIEYGLYAAKYHEKAPIPVLNVTDPNGAFGGGTYHLAYARNVKTYGAASRP